MRKYREETPNGPLLHCEASNGDDRTLCGCALEGENGDTPMQLTPRGRINCSDCTQVINFCQTITHHHLAPRGQRRTLLSRMVDRAERL